MSVMLNAYPDSIGGNFKSLVELLKKPEFKNVFSQFYILPSIFLSDLDRGFSVISYDIDHKMADVNELKELQEMGIQLLLDFVLNHLSVKSPQFKDLLKNGDNSKYKDFFIDWNKFWEGKSSISPEGFAIPDNEYLSRLFMRKPGLPVLKIPFPDGSFRYYWNTFYQRITETENGTEFLGQMDLNGESELVWEFYKETLSKMKKYGASLIRLDAFAYLHKEAGQTNFFNEPGTWNYLSRVKKIADSLGLSLLPEIHSKYEEGIHKDISKRGFQIYDFFFPGLVLHTIETRQPNELLKWTNEIITNNYKTVNMLGCHDGIPLLDVKGLLDENSIENLMSIVKKRGGRIKDLYDADGKKIAYYQINSTFYSALDEDEKKFLLARAIQIFMPGTPLVWYLDLFAGTNDYRAADELNHKEINRTNLSINSVESALSLPIVKKQLKLLRFRNTFRVFASDAKICVGKTEDGFMIKWVKDNAEASLLVNLGSLNFTIAYKNNPLEQGFLEL